MKECNSTHSISVFLFLFPLDVEKDERFLKRYKTEYKNEIRHKGEIVSNSYFTL